MQFIRNALKRTPGATVSVHMVLLFNLVVRSIRGPRSSKNLFIQTETITDDERIKKRKRIINDYFSFAHPRSGWPVELTTLLKKKPKVEQRV